MESKLTEKLSKVMAAVTHVEKRGKNTAQGYAYATDADILSAIRGAMIAEKLVLIPSVRQTDWREVQGRHGVIPVCVLTVNFTITDGQDRIEFVTVGSGMDSGDKGPYKAMTGAMKYALLKLFMIPTGDDPEADGDDDPVLPVPKAKAPEMPKCPYCHQSTEVVEALRDPSKGAFGCKKCGKQFDI